MFLKNIRRKKIKREPFPGEWFKIIERDVPLYKYLPNNLQFELQDLIKIFISEKNFEGCAGLKITDEIRVTIAAQACILLLNRKADYYPKLNSILVYPTAFITHRKSRDTIGIVSEFEQGLLGESWGKGIVVIAWDDTLKGAQRLHDGHNLIFHEFAHQLDTEDNIADGTPVLESSASYLPWVKVMSRNYEKLIKNTELGRYTLLGEYASTNPAEYFAVATEYFFEKPLKMIKEIPDLYSELKKFYKQDPLTYIKREPSL